jgi:hypothetical protein
MRLQREIAAGVPMPHNDGAGAEAVLGGWPERDPISGEPLTELAPEQRRRLAGDIHQRVDVRGDLGTFPQVLHGGFVVVVGPEVVPLGFANLAAASHPQRARPEPPHQLLCCRAVDHGAEDHAQPSAVEYVHDGLHV